MLSSLVQVLSLVIALGMGDAQEPGCVPSFLSLRADFYVREGGPKNNGVKKLENSVELADSLGLLEDPTATIGCDQTLLFTVQTPEEVGSKRF